MLQFAEAFLQKRTCVQLWLSARPKVCLVKKRNGQGHAEDEPSVPINKGKP